MNLLVYDKWSLKKYNEIWDKASNLIKKEFDRMPMNDNKFNKTKIKIYNNRIWTNFKDSKMLYCVLWVLSIDNKYCACLSVILLDLLLTEMLILSTNIFRRI